MHGICTRPPTGSQVRPRLCSMPISAAFSTWSGVPPSTSASAPAAIEQADADLALAAHLGAGDRGVLLVEACRSPPAVSRKRTTPSSSAPGHEARVVVQHRRDDAGRAVGGRGDDPPAGGVLLVDRQGVEVHPVHARPAGRRRLLGRAAAGAGRGARRCTLSPPGSTPSARQPRSTQSCMASQRSQQAGAHLLLGAPGQLVRHHHAADRQAGLGAAREQLGAGGERVAAPGCRPGRSGLPPTSSSSTTNPPPTE